LPTIVSSTDGLHGVQQEGPALGIAHVREERRDAYDGSGVVTPRHAANFEPQGPVVAECRMRQLDRVGGLARGGATHDGSKGGIAEQRQGRLGAATDGVRPHQAGEVLHGRVPLEHLERGIENDERLAEAVKETLGNLVRRNARHSPSMTGAPSAMQ
jgi:hypothetical protein